MWCATRKKEENGGELHQIFQLSLFLQFPFPPLFSGGSDGILALSTVASLKMWYPNIRSGKKKG